MTSKLSVWDKMKKMNLKAFSNWMDKKKVQVGDKVIKLREERELLGRFLIIHGSRPHFVPKLEQTIGRFEWQWCLALCVQVMGPFSSLQTK